MEVLMRFAEVADLRNDIAMVERCHAEAEELQRNIEEHGWDGEWYRRAYFDDGTPLTELRLSGGRRLLAASTSPFAIVWVAEGDGGRRLYVRALTGPR